MGGAYRAGSVLHSQARLSNIPTGLFLSLVTQPSVDLFTCKIWDRRKVRDKPREAGLFQKYSALTMG